MNNILLTFLLHSVNNNNCKRKLCNIFILLNFDNEKKKDINSAMNSFCKSLSTNFEYYEKSNFE